MSRWHQSCWTPASRWDRGCDGGWVHLYSYTHAHTQAAGLLPFLPLLSNDYRSERLTEQEDSTTVSMALHTAECGAGCTLYAFAVVRSWEHRKGKVPCAPPPPSHCLQDGATYSVSGRQQVPLYDPPGFNSNPGLATSLMRAWPQLQLDQVQELGVASLEQLLGLQPLFGRLLSLQRVEGDGQMRCGG